jgi:hypothetical protein
MQRRFFCEVRATATATASRADSARQAFMQLKPDRQTLDHLDHLGLGYVAKRRSRRAIATKYEKELPGVQSVVRSAQLERSRGGASSGKGKGKGKHMGAVKYVNASPYPFNKGPRKVQTIVTAKQWSEVRLDQARLG